MHSQKPLAPSIARLLWLVASIGIILVGAILLLLFGLPYQWAKPLADMTAKDGSLELFSPALHQKLQFLSWVGGVLMLLGGWMFLWRKRGSHVFATGMQKIHLIFHRWWIDFLSILKQIYQGRWELWNWVILAGIMGIALVVRLAVLDKPMTHDESYTVVAFASHSFRIVITDYHLPNNHVLHTILVYLVYHLLGSQPWIVRLPALAAGIVLIPASYLTGRTLFNPESGLLSAGLVAVSPVLVRFSTEARGYTLLCLFTLLVIGLGNFIRKQDNWSGWTLLGLFGALGMYTVPIMLYPLGIVFTWLFFSGLVGDTGNTTRSEFLKRWLFTGIGTGVFTMLLYSPILWVSGVKSLVGNRFVAPLSWTDFTGNLFFRLLRTWREWNITLPHEITILWMIGMVTTLIFHKKLSGQKFPFPTAALIWMTVILLYQRVAPFHRFWVWSLPILVIYAAAGLLFIVKEFLKLVRINPKGVIWFAFAGTMIIGFWGMRNAYMDVQTYREQPIGDIEEITIYLKRNLTPNDVVIAGSEAPVFWYYFQQYNIPYSYLFDIKHKSFQQAWVLVNTRRDETVATVAKRRGNFADVLDMAHAQFIFRQGRYEVYQVPHK